MKPGYANPSQPVAPNRTDDSEVTKESRKQDRMNNKAYYKLGIHKKTHARCESCGRHTGANHVCDTSKPKLAVQLIICPKCDAVVVFGASYCWSCGKWLI